MARPNPSPQWPESTSSGIEITMAHYVDTTGTVTLDNASGYDPLFVGGEMLLGKQQSITLDSGDVVSWALVSGGVVTYLDAYQSGALPIYVSGNRVLIGNPLNVAVATGTAYIY